MTEPEEVCKIMESLGFYHEDGTIWRHVQVGQIDIKGCEVGRDIPMLIFAAGSETVRENIRGELGL